MALKTRISRLERAFCPGVTPDEAMARFHEWCRMLWCEIMIPGQDVAEYQRDPVSDDELEQLAFEHELKNERTDSDSLAQWRKSWVNIFSH